MAATLRIIEENIPELLSLNLSSNRLYKLDDMSSIVQKAPNLKTLNLSGNELKTERELDKIKGLKLEELWLDRNPMCDNFGDQSSYIRSVVASVSPPGDIHPWEAELMHPDQCPSTGEHAALSWNHLFFGRRIMYSFLPVCCLLALSQISSFFSPDFCSLVLAFLLLS